MWTFFCERVAEASGGERMGEIRVLTERERPDDRPRLDAEAGGAGPAPGDDG